MPIRLKLLSPRGATAALAFGAFAVICAAGLHAFGLSVHSVGESAIAINTAARTTAVAVVHSAEYMIDISTHPAPLAA